MVGQTPASNSNGTTVRTLELVFASIAIFGAAFAVAKAAFERNLPYTPGGGGAVPNPMRRGWSYRPPVKGYTLPGTSRPAGGWPIYEIRLQLAARNYYDLFAMEQWPGDRPTMTPIVDATGHPVSYRNKNEALYQAGLALQRYADTNRRNTNKLRVLDEVGQCVYVIRASVHDPGFDELKC